jgi:NAD-dependent dihydropyrimidine dehydrogenase PreA subunit
MTLRDLPAYVRDTVLRMLPHSGPTGLVPIGTPGADAPVLVTGNFTLTIRRLRQVLNGVDAWLLCANSKGINVWCAAGGGHLTHHDVISAMRTSGLDERVTHREMILPQLCATGVERRKITEATGWATRWGPARLEDLPTFLRHGQRVHRGERRMRFPLWERAEMATMWSVPTVLLAAPLIAWLGGAAACFAAVAGMFAEVFGLFALLPWIPAHGRLRWPTFVVFAVGGVGVCAAVLRASAALTQGHLLLVGIFAAVMMGVLSADLEGTTPWYGSFINTFHNVAHITLDQGACTGRADCVLVCPSDVLQMNGKARKVEIARPSQCIQCGACIVQCPSDALSFHYDDGRVLTPQTVRTTRMNMAGRRAISVER